MTADAGTFRQNAEIFCMHRLDLGDISTVFHFADDVMSRYFYVYSAFVIFSTFFFRYPCVCHLICNAGLVSFDSIHWPSAIEQMLLDPSMGAVSQPRYEAACNIKRRRIRLDLDSGSATFLATSCLYVTSSPDQHMS